MPGFKKRRSYKKRTTYKKRSARGGKRSSAVSSAVRKYVKSSIHKQIENKSIQAQGALVFGSVVNDPTMHMYPMTPYPGYIQLSQGITQSTRVGNEVRVRKVLLKYVICPNPYSATTNTSPRPCEIQMWLGFVKNASGFLPQATDVDNLFQYNSSDTLPLGTLMDLNQQINKDFWTIKKYWTHKIGFSSSNGTGNVAGSQSFNNNDFKLNAVRRLDITKIYPKVLKFNDNTSQLQGQGLFLFFQAVPADGSTFAGTQTPVQIQFQVDIDYEDA